MPRGYKNRSYNKNKWDNEERIRPPPGLRGKEIGLFYRNLSLQKKNRSDEPDYSTIKFSIPKSVVKRVRVLLQAIGDMEEGKKVKEVFMKTFKSSCIFENTEFSDDISLIPEFKKPVLKCDPTLETNAAVMSKDGNTEFENEGNEKLDNPSASFTSFRPRAGALSTPNLIEVKKEEPAGCGSSYDYLPLRPTKDVYKFSYNDIITGSFEEKLDICLADETKFPNVTEELNEKFYNEYKDIVNRPTYKKLLEFREQLPTYKKSKEILDIIKNNQVLVISGETGCGKSTQVPQIILDDAMKSRKGAATKIIVTQPRRIAASSLAKRVAQERGEEIGSSVGYAVRLEKVDPRSQCSIMFCTTGVLLCDLEVNQGLNEFSHVILDEVHERDVNIDLAMCLLRQIIKKRSDLKIILMSATLDADRLSEYYGGCSLMHIEGLAYPVKDIYLEDIIEMTQYSIKDTFKNRPKKHFKHQKKSNVLDLQKEIQYKAEIGPWITTVMDKLSCPTVTTLLDERIELLDIDLIVTLLIHICKGKPGAILVFLPGIGEIKNLMKEMDISKAFPRSNYEIYPLHSKLASLEQNRIFERPPSHIRKIIIATNIAETSITIDDIVYVVDCGRIKVKGLDIEDNTPTLKNEWASQANLRQRRGRAGRCQPGICYHLMTSFRANKLEMRMLPELQRSDLLESVLAIKKLRLGKAAEALSMVPDPPAMSTIKWAVSHLKQCGALNENEILTPLGWHLARIPAHPAAGKLLILGALFGCLDRAASVAAVWGFKDPFQLVLGKETESDEARRRFALGEPSDHVAVSEAILRWECYGPGRSSFAYHNYLSNNTLELLRDMKRQFGDNLKQMGFVPNGNVKADWENRNVNNMSLFKAIVAASLYPNIASVRWVGLNTIRKNPTLKVRLPNKAKANLHPSSVMGSRHDQTLRGRPKRPLCDKPGANWLTYWIKQMSTDLYLLDVTLVYTFPLLFFGELHLLDAGIEYPNHCYILISSYKLRCEKEMARLLFELRSLLDHVLANKVAMFSDHGIRHSPFEESVLNAVTELITAEDEQTEYMSDDDDDGSDISEMNAASGSRQRRYYY